MKKKRKLVVDDEPGMLTLAKIALDDPGWEITTACDGRECLDMLKGSERPDLIILDIMMPKISGYDVCTCGTEVSKGKTTPFEDIAIENQWGYNINKVLCREGAIWLKN